QKMDNLTTDGNTTVQRLSDSAYMATGIYLIFVAILATLGNILVLSVILGDPKLRAKPHNVLIINLAIADIGISFSGYPLTTISGFYGQWIFSDVACTITGFISFLLSLGSMNTLMCISIYRYIMICRPENRKYLNDRNTKRVLICIWTHALTWTGLPLLGWGGYALEPFGTSCSLDWANGEYRNVTYLVCTIIVCYIIHVIVIGYCYKHVIQTTQKLKCWNVQRQHTLTTMNDMLWIHKVMCIILVMSFLIIWTPYAVVCVIYIIIPDLPIEVTTIPTMFCKAGCMVNPIIYFCTNNQFREACKHIYCGCLYKKVSSGVVP
ncbi:hypothetical protein LOTGIDRAFT_116468, partial [Lottia gigantea]